MNERFNIGGRGIAPDDIGRVRRKPVLIVTGEHDPRHSRAFDQRTATHLHADFVWLPDSGQSGNGHMLMLEDSSTAISTLVLDWLAARELGPHV
jgi:pimeloyl-ACP methyl ester carboxylesterase